MRIVKCLLAYVLMDKRGFFAYILMYMQNELTGIDEKSVDVSLLTYVYFCTFKPFICAYFALFKGIT